MFQALLYLQYHSTKNRLLMRIRRLRQPKYLFGAIIGGAYFYFYFFRYLFGFHGRSSAATLPVPNPENLAFFESLGALVFFTILLLAWLLPRERAALAFSEAEVAFLFPAPISRRSLIHFKVLRSQTAIFFASIMLMLFTRRAGGHAWSRALGWWVILSVLNLHTIGASFARTMLMDRGLTTWKRRLLILLLVLAAVVGVGLWARQTVPALEVSPFDNLPAFRNYILQVLGTGPGRILLFPWRLVVRPYLAPDLHFLLLAIGPAFLVLITHYFWVIRSDVAFEEASIEASTKLANRVAAIRAGNWRGGPRKFKRKRPPFAMASTGPAFVGLVWKNLISAGQGFAPRTLIVFAITAGAMCFGLRGSASTAGWQPILGLIAGMLMLWTVLIGPQFMRQDFRQDLQQVDLLKSYPMRGWQIALGEVLAPVLVLAGVQCLLLILAVGLISPDFFHGLFFSRRLILGSGIAVLLPMLDLVVLQIPNAAVLLFPAWFQPGKAAPQGIEATGQRIILMLGSLLVLVASLIPAGGVFVGIFFLCRLFLSVYASVPIACLAAAVVLAAEAAGGIMLLGKIFERFDSSAELSG